MENVINPQASIVIGDNHDAGTGGSFFIGALHNGLSVGNALRARRHNEGGHYLFADGHIEWISAVEMSRRLQVNNKEIFKPF